MRRQSAGSAPATAARRIRPEAWLAAAVALLLAVAGMFGLPSNRAAAAPGDFTVAPTDLDFGDVAIGVTSGPIDVVITNVDVSGHDPQVSGGSPSSFQFIHSNGCDGLFVDAGESCMASFYFSPLSNGTYTATAMLEVDGEAYLITLTGTGVLAVPTTTTTEPGEATTSTTASTTSTTTTTTPVPDCSTTTTTQPSIETSSSSSTTTSPTSSTSTTSTTSPAVTSTTVDPCSPPVQCASTTTAATVATTIPTTSATTPASTTTTLPILVDTTSTTTPPIPTDPPRASTTTTAAPIPTGPPRASTTTTIVVGIPTVPIDQFTGPPIVGPAGRSRSISVAQVDPCASPTTLVSSGGGALPATGSNSSIVIALATLLVLAGGAMVVVRRRS